MGTLSLGLVLVLNLVLLIVVIGHFRRQPRPLQDDAITELARQAATFHESLSQRFTTATADMAMRLEQTKGDLRQQVSDRLEQGFSRIHNSVEEQLTCGRREQTDGLTGARTELTASLALTTSQLKTEFDCLNQKTVKRLNAIREHGHETLLALCDWVQRTLALNLKE